MSVDLRTFIEEVTILAFLQQVEKRKKGASASAIRNSSFSCLVPCTFLPYVYCVLGTWYPIYPRNKANVALPR